MLLIALDCEWPYSIIKVSGLVVSSVETVLALHILTIMMSKRKQVYNMQQGILHSVTVAHKRICALHPVAAALQAGHCVYLVNVIQLYTEYLHTMCFRPSSTMGCSEPDC